MDQFRGEHKIVFRYEHNEQARGPYTHEPRDVPRCGVLSLLQRPLHCRDVQRNSRHRLFEVGLGPVVARARVLVHEVTRAEELAERQRAPSFDRAGLEVEE